MPEDKQKTAPAPNNPPPQVSADKSRQNPQLRMRTERNSFPPKLKPEKRGW